MATETEKLTQGIELFRDMFINRADVMARQRQDGQYRLVKGLSDVQVSGILHDHLKGGATWGAYVTDTAAMCKWLCLDIDLNLELQTQPIDPLDAAHIRLETARVLTVHLRQMGVPEACMVLEFSGNKGYHIWIFLVKPAPACAVQAFWSDGISSMPTVHELVHLDYFPNHRSDYARVQYGHQVKLPLGIHQKSGKWSCLCDLNGQALDNPLDVLGSVPKWTLPAPYFDNPTSCAINNTRKREESARKIVRAHPAQTAVAQPELTTDLKRLFENCRFMQDFKNDPSGTTYHGWKHAGIVLCQFEQGAEWFTYLSSLDAARFDGSHEDIIRNVSRQGLRAPCCSTIGCGECDRKNPLEAAGIKTRHYRQCYMGDPEPCETIGVDRLRDELRLSVHDLLMSGATGVYLVCVPLGVGKTRIVREVMEALGKRALWYAPAHEQADELARDFRVPVARIYGRERMHGTQGFACPHLNALNNAAQRGLPSEERYCHGRGGLCSMRQDCAYQIQFSQARDHKVLILVHDHLKLGKRKRADLMENRELLVIDEDFTARFYREITINENDLTALRDAVMRCGFEPLVRKWVEPLLGLLKSPAGASMQVPVFDMPDGLVRQVNQKFLADVWGKNVLMDLIKLAGGNIKVRMQGDKPVLWFVEPAHLPKDKLVLILDATGSVEDYQRLLSDGYTVRVIDPLDGRRLEKHVRVIQCLSGGYSNATLIEKSGSISLSGKHIVEFIKSKLDRSTPAGVISTAQFEKHLAEALRDYPNVEFTHFRNQRGVNKMADKSVLFVVGYQGLSYEDLARETNKRFDLNLDVDATAAQLEQDRRFVPLSYNKDGMGYEVETLQPTDVRVAALYRMEVCAEVEQAVGRIRPYNPAGHSRTLYLLTNMPVGIEVDEVFDLNEPDTPPALRAMLEAAGMLLQARDEFTQRELQAFAGLGRTALHEHRVEMCRLLGLVHYKSGRNTVYAREPVVLAA